MRTMILTLAFVLSAFLSVDAVEFLGTDLCAGRVDPNVVLPEDSGLRLMSAEVGDEGALLLLLAGEEGQVLDRIDRLMTEITGVSGSGEGKSLQWSGDTISAFAQRLKPGLAALAVSASGPCIDAAAVEAPVVLTAPVEPETTGVGTVVPDAAAEEPGTPAAPAVAAMPAVAATESEPVVEHGETGEDFQLLGTLRHTAYGDDWVDVMGVIANDTGNDYDVATFDLSLYDGSGALICVDTISVNVLKHGQRRAFRDSIRCPGYSADAVARTELQFAGGL